MSKYIRENLHILELTPETSKLFNRNSIFVSYKMESNINSLICRNKFVNKSKHTVQLEGVEDVLSTNIAPEQPLPTADNIGCFKCSGCTFCDNFLIESKTFSSSKTKQIFTIKSYITCTTPNVIYVIYDKICADIFYVGNTLNGTQIRWRNHKSHIKKGINKCEITNHFLKTSNTIHKLDKSNQNIFTSELSKHLEVIIIECVEPLPNKTMKEACEARESFWQGILKSTQFFGGLNKRKNNLH